MDILDIFLDILLKPPQPLMGLFFVNTVNMKIKACNALNGMFVDTVKDTGVCGSYTSTVYRVMRCKNSSPLCIQRPLAPPRGKATVDLLCLPSCGFSCSSVSPRRQLCYLSGTCKNYKGNCRQDANPIPNS